MKTARFQFIDNSNLRYMTLSKKSLKLLILLLMVSFPIKAVSLLFMILYFIFIIQKKRFDPISLGGVFFVIIVNLISNLLVYNTFQFLKNSLLFWIFLLPTLSFIVIKNLPALKQYSPKDVKLAIEIYLIIQIFFSLVNILYGFINKYSFDLAFGDIIAGTYVVHVNSYYFKAPYFIIFSDHEINNLDKIEGFVLKNKLKEDQLYVIRKFLSSLNTLNFKEKMYLSNILADKVSKATGIERGKMDPVEFLKKIYKLHESSY